ncbi:MAG TPA: hypothetical protein VHY35_15445 [Stellaceae bacterium]|nr:hypothetical protein [Stellaceae bacterium]
MTAGPETMDHAGGQGELGELSLCSWVSFWAQLVVLGLLAVLGAFFAGENSAPGDSTCGLILFVAAFALAFMRLKNYFDGDARGWGNFLLVDDLASLVAAIVVFVILALAGLFVAAATDHGGLHNGGVALFVTSGIGVFLSLKHVFDNLDRHTPDHQH